MANGQEKGVGMNRRPRGLTRLPRVKSSPADRAGLTSRFCAHRVKLIVRMSGALVGPPRAGTALKED